MTPYIKWEESKIAAYNDSFVFSLAAIIAFAIYHYFCPGFISFDTLEQYKQAAGMVKIYTAHPVIMTYFWMLIIKLTGKPEVLFLVLQLFYWLTTALISNVISNKLSNRIIVLIIIGFWPPAFLLSLNVWKDVIMLAALSFASISAYCFSFSHKRRWLFFCLIGLFISTAVRINGFIPSLVIASGLFSVYFIERRKNKLLGCLLGVSCSLLFVLSCFVMISLINIKADKTYDLGTLGVWDLVSISIGENENVLPDYLLAGKDKANLISDFNSFNSREANFPVYSYISPYPPIENQSSFKYDWLNAIAEHPKAYLEHRWYVFKVLSGKEVNGHTYYPFQPGIQSNSYGFYFQNINTDTASAIVNFFVLISDTLFFKVYLYYIASIFIILIGFYRIKRNVGYKAETIVIISISISGLVSNLSLFFLATAADFRYSIWEISSVVIAVSMLLSTRCVKLK